jgi:hypothetical protein
MATGPKPPNDFDVLSYAQAFGCHPSKLLPRETVREITCPSCQAAPGFPCSGRHGQIRESNHLARCFERIRLQMPANWVSSEVKSSTGLIVPKSWPDPEDQAWWEETESQEQEKADSWTKG